MNSDRMILPHKDAQAFFESALHPDWNELQRRDRFLSQIEEQVQIQDGIPTSYLADDLDIEGLLGTCNGYFPFEDADWTFSITISSHSHDSYKEAYMVFSEQDIAA